MCCIRPSFMVLPVDPVFPMPTAESTLSPLRGLGPLVKSQLVFCVDSYLLLQFYPVHQCTDPHANTTLFWLLGLFSTLEIRKCKFPNFGLFQDVFALAGLLELPWRREMAYAFLQKWPLGFWHGLNRFGRLPWDFCQLNNVKSSKPRPWEGSPLIQGFSNFFQQIEECHSV